MLPVLIVMLSESCVYNQSLPSGALGKMILIVSFQLPWRTFCRVESGAESWNSDRSDLDIVQ